MGHRFQLIYARSEVEKFSKSIVALCGLGGYGSALVDPLSRYELQELRLADPDSYETSNMDRQCLARFSTIGRNKTEVAGELVAEITHHTRATLFSSGIQIDNVERFCEGANIVLDLCDQLSARLLLARTCREKKIPLISGGSIEWPSREGIRVEVYRYDKSSVKNKFMLEKWGITRETWKKFKESIARGHISWATLRKIDFENAVFRSRKPPTIWGTGKEVIWNSGGGYDPLKISSLTAGVLECFIEILIGRKPKHHTLSISMK